jgi:hypothetical protein
MQCNLVAATPVGPNEKESNMSENQYDAAVKNGNQLFLAYTGDVAAGIFLHLGNKPTYMDAVNKVNKRSGFTSAHPGPGKNRNGCKAVGRCQTTSSKHLIVNCPRESPPMSPNEKRESAGSLRKGSLHKCHNLTRDYPSVGQPEASQIIASVESAATSHGAR